MQKEFKVAGVSDASGKGFRTMVLIARNGEAWIADATEKFMLSIGTVVRVPSSQIDGMPNFNSYNFLKSREARRATRSEIEEVWSPDFAKAS